MRTEIRITAGGQFTDTIRVSNDSAARMRIRSDSLDWYIDEQMTPQFADVYPNEASLSCREWLQINPRESEVEPAGDMRARYTLQVPAGTHKVSIIAGWVSLRFRPSINRTLTSA